jgi:hypothetical protein
MMLFGLLMSALTGMLIQIHGLSQDDTAEFVGGTSVFLICSITLALREI